MVPFNRRRFLKFGAGVGGGAALSRIAPRAAYALASSLDPAAIPKFVLPLVIPPAMPRTGTLSRQGGKNFDYYEIAVRQFRQRILPPPFEETTVWGYGSIQHPETFNYPSFTIEARFRKPVAVKWVNQLVDADNNYLPHLFTVDPTLHWANPPGGEAGRDMRPSFGPSTFPACLGAKPPPYTGPVPIVTHLHGADGTEEESDGFTEAWYLPDADDIPDGYATTGTYYEPFRGSSPLGDLWTPGSAVFSYENDQRPTALWYHDHALGMTRLNVYAGPAGFYLLRGGPEDAKDAELPGPAPQEGDPPGTRYYEIPLAIQDRSFHADGSLAYPASRASFGDYSGPFTPCPVPGTHPEQFISPYWVPEFFGDVMVVNGRAWPRLEVEQRRYRFRILNGCDARVLILRAGSLDNQTFRVLWLIGADGGFLPEPLPVPQVVLSPAQRADVIIDFTELPIGTDVVLFNLGPDEALDGVPSPPADPRTTGQVMLFRVQSPARTPDRSTPPNRLRLPRFTPLGPATHPTPRRVSLIESMVGAPAGVPNMVLLGTVDSQGKGVPLLWDDPPTETPVAGETEIWEIYNFTVDAHPIHLHETQFQLVDRQSMDGDPAPLPFAQESGFIDTVIALPHQITRIKVSFPRPGRFVWHCHILEHEDNEMMRPLVVLPAT